MDMVEPLLWSAAASRMSNGTWMTFKGKWTAHAEKVLRTRSSIVAKRLSCYYCSVRPAATTDDDCVVVIPLENDAAYSR